MGEAIISRKGGGSGDCKVIKYTEKPGEEIYDVSSIKKITNIDVHKYDYILDLIIEIPTTSFGDVHRQETYVIKNGVITETRIQKSNRLGKYDDKSIMIVSVKDNEISISSSTGYGEVINKLSTIIEVKAGSLSDTAIKEIFCE